MLFTADGQLNMQMDRLSCYGSVAGGRLFVNIKQSYTNVAGTGVSVFRFKLPEKSFVSKLEVKTPDKEVSTEYIPNRESEELKNNASSGASPITLDGNGYFSAVIGVTKPEQKIEISFTYIQEISVYRSIKITIPLRTGERLSPDFKMSANFTWHTASGKITADSTYGTIIEKNTITLIDGCLPDKDIILSLKAERISLCNIYKGKDYTLLDAALPFEPIRKQRPHEYLFVIDISKSVKEQWENIKNAVLTCICALEENESFNIAAFDLSPRLLSIGALRATDSSKASARAWLSGIKPAGSADIGEAMSFAYDLCSRRTEIFLVTNSQFINPNKILSDASGRIYSAINVVSGNKEYSEAAEALARAGGGHAERVNGQSEIADGLCRLLSRTLLSGVENSLLKTDKNLVWHLENTGKIYPWDRLLLCKNSSAAVPEKAEICANADESAIRVNYDVKRPDKAADILAALYMAETNKNAENISRKYNIPSQTTSLALNVLSESQALQFPVCGAEGGGSDKPVNTRKNAPALLAMQSTNGSIGSPSETAGRLWEIMTSHPAPSIYMLQIKKAIEYLLDFVQLGEYDLLPDRILDVFELWLEMFPSDTIFAKKIEALVYMNRK